MSDHKSDQTENAAGASIVAAATVAEATSSQTKRNCKFHAACTRSNDPAHQAQFICNYQKACKHGAKCSLAGDTEHQKFFTHETVSASANAASATTKTSKGRSRREHAPSRRQSTTMTDSNSYKATVKFTLAATFVDGRKISVTDAVYETRVPNKFNAEQAKAYVMTGILKQYIGRSAVVTQDFKSEIFAFSTNTATDSEILRISKPVGIIPVSLPIPSQPVRSADEASSVSVPETQ